MTHSSNREPRPSPITVSTEGREAVLAPPSDDVLSPEPLNVHETLVDLTLRSVQFAPEDFTKWGMGLIKGPYSMRILHGGNAYAIARVRDGLSIIDVSHYRDALEEYRSMATDPIDLEESEAGNSIAALDVSAKGVDPENPTLELDGGEAGKVVVKRDENGAYTFELQDKEDTTATRLFYPKYENSSQPYNPDFDVDSISSRISFDSFKDAAERQIEPRRRVGTMIAKLYGRSRK